MLTKPQQGNATVWVGIVCLTLIIIVTLTGPTPKASLAKTEVHIGRGIGSLELAYDRQHHLIMTAFPHADVPGKSRDLGLVDKNTKPDNECPHVTELKFDDVEGFYAQVEYEATFIGETPVHLNRLKVCAHPHPTS